jgi:GNAT superfamily N-acetyltransferase
MIIAKSFEPGERCTIWQRWSELLPLVTHSLRLRGATPDDASRLAELSAILGYPVSAATMSRRLERILLLAGDIVLVAERPDGSVVGWIHGAERELLESGARCEILGLVVDQTQRRHGIGRSLVAAVESWALQRGIEQIAVRSNVVRAESHPFYEQLGYLRVKTQHSYRKRLGVAS